MTNSRTGAEWAQSSSARYGQHWSSIAPLPAPALTCRWVEAPAQDAPLNRQNGKVERAEEVPQLDGAAEDRDRAGRAQENRLACTKRADACRAAGRIVKEGLPL